MEKKNETLNRGIGLVVLASLCWSLNSPLVKVLQLSAFTLTGARALIAGIALAPFIRPRRIRWNADTLFMILSYIAHCTLIVLALKLTSAPIAVAMQFTAPLWLFAWEHKRGEALRLRRLWPLCVMLLGMGLFMCSKGDGATTAGNIVAACSSLTFALLTYFSKRASGDNPVGMTSVCNLATALIMLTLFSKTPFAEIAALSTVQRFVLLILGVVQTGCGYALYYLGLRDVDASTAAMISPLEMVLGPIWVMLFLHEYTDVIGLIAFSLVILGVLGEVFVSKKRGA